MSDPSVSLSQPVRGMRDYVADDGAHLLRLIQIFWGQAELFGYIPCLTPILEGAGVFSRSLGETSDVLTKEMYTLQDRGGDPLVLRPEGTAGVVRALLSNGLHQDMPARFGYAGPMFRYERPQKGRLRQFHQVGVEHFGEGSDHADIESLNLSYQFLRAIGVAPDATLQINTLGDHDSRAVFRAALIDYLTPLQSSLSPDSQRRLTTNPLRILDSKDAGDHEILQGAPSLHKALNPSSRAHFDAVCQGLSDLAIPFQINARIVRGLDYYVHTTFEWVHDGLGAQGTILAGGRYDGLVKTMGGPDLAGIGWAAGLERLMLATSAPKAQVSLFVMPLEPEQTAAARGIAQNLRDIGHAAEVWAEGSLKKRLKKAAVRGCQRVIFLDPNDIITLKDMNTGHQQTLTRDELLNTLR